MIRHGDLLAAAQDCQEIAVTMLDGEDIPEKTARLASAAFDCAREGVPIDTVLYVIHLGIDVGIDLVVPNVTAADYDDLIAGVPARTELLEIINGAIARAYLRELQVTVRDRRASVRALTSALLAGHATALFSRECGIDVASRYSVVALSIPENPGESPTMVDGSAAAHRRLGRIQALLTVQYSETVLADLGADDTTLLAPTEEFADADLEVLVDRLSQAAGAPIIAAVVPAVLAQIPEAAKHAHELLDVAHRLKRAPALYRFNDLVLEYQATRPGPGREALVSILDPLDAHPELLETLECHIGTGFNRKRTAHTLHIHANTVDYRIKRIGRLTGIDSAAISGLFHLRLALIARTYIGAETNTFAS
ncbi:MAG: putative transcriptional regulator [Nocardia sp.]|uniref:PucR family transcriptional regulator n=1 Tax=Nocardia sp. TaxID=1821 RepID=UPI00260DC55D|nr:helix-turn-helix domain-containing protein [Nocardia sp.]MCU1644382.1 putative transcriptional regulator [Nocardia sp.]